jgi:predicted HTH transcriptional regulator
LANNVLLKVWKKKKKASGILIQYKGAEDILLSYLKENETITLSRFCKIAKLTRGEAEDILANLISLGILNIKFTEKQVYYSLNTSASETFNE